MKNLDTYYEGLAKQYGKHNPNETQGKLSVLYPKKKSNEPSLDKEKEEKFGSSKK